MMKEFGWFIYGLIGLGVLWFFMGGADRPIAREGIYLNPPAPLDNGRAYGGPILSPRDSAKEVLEIPTPPDTVVSLGGSGTIHFDNVAEIEKIHGISLLAQRLILDGKAGAAAAEPRDEYVRILLHKDAQSNETLSGFTLRGSALGSVASIPRGTKLPILGVTYKEEAIVLSPDDRVIVSSGRSPIGTSFQVNMCTGYLGQFQEFRPELRKECPEPLDELRETTLYTETACREFVENIPRCETWSKDFPSYLSDRCRAFVVEKLNYNSCSLRHSAAPEFQKNEWRVFLGSTKELWGNTKDIVKLTDQKGNLVDAISY